MKLNELIDRLDNSREEMREMGIDPNTEVCVGWIAGVDRVSGVEVCSTLDGDDLPEWIILLHVERKP